MLKKYMYSLSRFGSWLFTWPKVVCLIVYMIINTILFLLPSVINNLESKYIFSKFIIFTCFLPPLLLVIFYDINKRFFWDKNLAKKWKLVITIIVSAICIIPAVLAVIDLLHNPVYFYGEVEEINRGRRTFVQLKDNEMLYFEYTYKIQIQEYHSYLFRLMPVSQDLIAVEQND